MDDGTNDNSFGLTGRPDLPHCDPVFIPAGKAINDVVVKLSDRRDRARANNTAAKVSKHTETMFQNSLRHLNAIEQANGHLIAAWKIYVAECATQEEARLKITSALISITSQPVTKQE